VPVPSQPAFRFRRSATRKDLALSESPDLPGHHLFASHIGSDKFGKGTDDWAQFQWHCVKRVPVDIDMSRFEVIKSLIRIPCPRLCGFNALITRSLMEPQLSYSLIPSPLPQMRHHLNQFPSMTCPSHRFFREISTQNQKKNPALSKTKASTLSSPFPFSG